MQATTILTTMNHHARPDQPLHNGSGRHSTGIHKYVVLRHTTQLLLGFPLQKIQV
jgi:hypothetical protein